MSRIRPCTPAADKGSNANDPKANDANANDPKVNDATKSPKSKKRSKQPALPWDGAHSHAFADWKLGHIMREFQMSEYDWGVLGLDVNSLPICSLILVRWIDAGMNY